MGITETVDGKQIIKFYRATGKFGFLSNLFKKPVEFEGKTFPTAEHAYQYGKIKVQFKDKTDESVRN